MTINLQMVRAICGERGLLLHEHGEGITLTIAGEDSVSSGSLTLHVNERGGYDEHLIANWLGIGSAALLQTKGPVPLGALRSTTGAEII